MQPWFWQDYPCWWQMSTSAFTFGFPHCSHLMYLAEGDTKNCVDVILAYFWRNSLILFNSRFCSGEKFLFGFRDLFFCLFLDNVSAAPSESSNALFWHTVFFTSDVWLFPLETCSFGLQETNADQVSGRSCCSSLWLCYRKKTTTKDSNLRRSNIRLTGPVGKRQVSTLFSICSSGNLILHNHNRFISILSSIKEQLAD